jgi:hypothetical protein
MMLLACNACDGFTRVTISGNFPGAFFMRQAYVLMTEVAIEQLISETIKSSIDFVLAAMRCKMSWSMYACVTFSYWSDIVKLFIDDAMQQCHRARHQTYSWFSQFDTLSNYCSGTPFRGEVKDVNSWLVNWLPSMKRFWPKKRQSVLSRMLLANLLTYCPARWW